MKKITSKVKQSTLIFNIGFALVFTGVPLGMFFNHLFPFGEWSPVMMFLSVAFIMSYKNVIVGQFPSFNKMFLIILAFQLLMISYGLVSERFEFKYLSFHLFIILLIVAFASNHRNYNYEKIIITTFWVSTICSILGIFFLNSGVMTDPDMYEIRKSTNYVLDPFTICIGAITNFTCAIFLLQKEKKLKIIIWTFVCLDILILFLSTKRTPVFISLVVLFMFFYRMGSVSKEMLIKFSKLFIALMVMILLLYSTLEVVTEKIDDFVFNFYTGVLNIFGDSSVSDTNGSAIMRYNGRLLAYEYAEKNFTILEYIIGGGYMIAWMDNPLLQSYFDMGFLGVILYLYIVILYPIKVYFKLPNILALFAMLMCVYNILSSYSSGHPYAYIKYTPVVVLAFVLNIQRNK